MISITPSANDDNSSVPCLALNKCNTFKDVVRFWNKDNNKISISNLPNHFMLSMGIVKRYYLMLKQKIFSYISNHSWNWVGFNVSFLVWRTSINQKYQLQNGLWVKLGGVTHKYVLTVLIVSKFRWNIESYRTNEIKLRSKLRNGKTTVKPGIRYTKIVTKRSFAIFVFNSFVILEWFILCGNDVG